MLVLSRRVGEEIVIDKGQIQVKVLGQSGDCVAIGILAPDHVDVDRKEIYLRRISNQERQESA